MPDLESLYLNLQTAKSDPTKSLDHFARVARDVENIVNRPAERFLIFKANTREE